MTDFKTIDLHTCDAEAQKAYMKQVFRILHNNYGSFAESESEQEWLDTLYAPGKRGTTLQVSAVVNARNEVVGFSALQRYDEKIGKGTALITYSCCDTAVEGSEHMDVIGQSKAGVLRSVADLQAQGVRFNAVFQEHMLIKAGHVLKIAEGMKLGQVPTSSPSMPGRVFSNYKIPPFLADVKPREGESAPEVAARANGDLTPASLLMSDIQPHDPHMPMRDVLKAFITGYCENNSYFSSKHGRQIRNDGAFQTMMAYADSLPLTLTYRQAYDQASQDAEKHINKAWKALSHNAGKTVSGIERPIILNALKDLGYSWQESMAYVDHIGLCLQDKTYRLTYGDEFANDLVNTITAQREEMERISRPSLTASL